MHEGAHDMNIIYLPSEYQYNSTYIKQVSKQNDVEKCRNKIFGGYYSARG
jgi:hypothetical protein